MIFKWTGPRIEEQLPLLRRYARSLTRNDVDADDLVHDALVRAYEKKHTFRADGNVRTWLLAIVHNLFVSEWRRKKSGEASLRQLSGLSDPRSMPSQEHAVYLRQIEAALHTLPPDQRSALHLVVVEGLSYQEAASALDVPIGTLMSRVNRARTLLREANPPSSDRLPNLRVVRGSDE